MKTLLSRGLIAAAVFVTLAGLHGCNRGANKQDPNAPPGNDKKNTNQNANKPVVKVSAEDFRAEVNKPGQAAAKKYQGSVVEVEGEVVTADWADENEKGVVTLKAGPKLTDLVMCYTTDKRPWNKVVPGQKVTMRGDYPEFTVFPSILNAEVKEAGPSPAVTMTSQELAGEYAKDREATDKKYKDKILIVTGPIEAKEKRDVTLKGTDKVKVVAAFDGFVGKLADPLKVGDTITFQGKYTGLTNNESKVEFYFPMLMTK